MTGYGLSAFSARQFRAQVRRDADPLMVLNHLYKRTELQRNFAGNLMAVLGEGRMPQQMTLRQALQ
eukprot:3706234-Pleurochrysis_carterae.AAC.1